MVKGFLIAEVLFQGVVVSVRESRRHFLLRAGAGFAGGGLSRLDRHVFLPAYLQETCFALARSWSWGMARKGSERAGKMDHASPARSGGFEYRFV